MVLGKRGMALEKRAWRRTMLKVARGNTTYVGLGADLFLIGDSNLQKGFDLLIIC